MFFSFLGHCPPHLHQHDHQDCIKAKTDQKFHWEHPPNPKIKKSPANKIWQPSQRERCWSPRNLRGPASVAYRLSRPLRPRSPSTATQRLPWLLQPVQGGRSVLDVHGQLLRLTLLPHMCKGSALGDWHCGERHNDSGLIWFNLEKYIWIGFSSFKSKNWPALLNKFNIFSNATCEPCLETCD